MLNEHYKKMLHNKSVIREMAEYATRRGQEIGYENVFDYSLGNPSVPTPQDYTDEVIRLHREEEPVKLHGYSPSLGNTHAREVVAASLSRRFGLPYTSEHIFMTSGAAGAIAHALRAVTAPGDTVVTFAPFFPEYVPYVEGAGLKLVVVPPDTAHFQVDLAAFEKLLTPDVQAVLINSPNNPSGTVYSAETLTEMARIMHEKEAAFGHDIFLISDEPYREIAFDGQKVPYPSSFYDNSISCYSFSKSLSLPGERIGYLAVNPAADGADVLVPMCGQISRGIGHNCPASTPQLGICAVIDETADLSVYETNMNLLYDALTGLHFNVVRPGGTFYIFPQAPEADSAAFCRKALAYDLILVPGDNFGCPGWFRMAYCIDTEKVRRSIPVLERFIRTEYPDF